MNAAVWFGAAVFFTLGAHPALFSLSLESLIGTNNFPYFSFAISDLVATRFFWLYAVCAVVAVLYLVAEWLYFGKYPPRWWLIFICALVLLGFFRGFWVEPALRNLHEVQYGRQSRPEERQIAARAFKTWNSIARSLDLLFVVSLGFYVWRVGNPSDPMRFVSASKFRS
jgi:hypothetical protein